MWTDCVLLLSRFWMINRAMDTTKCSGSCVYSIVMLPLHTLEFGSESTSARFSLKWSHKHRITWNRAFRRGQPSDRTSTAGEQWCRDDVLRGEKRSGASAALFFTLSSCFAWNSRAIRRSLPRSKYVCFQCICLKHTMRLFSFEKVLKKSSCPVLHVLTVKIS